MHPGPNLKICKWMFKTICTRTMWFKKKTWPTHRESKFCKRTHICIYKCLLNNVYRTSCIVLQMLQPKWSIFPNPNKNNPSWPCPKTHRNKTPHNQRTEAGANQTNHVRHLRGRHEAEFWGHGSYSNQIYTNMVNNYPTIRKVTISITWCIISFVYLSELNELYTVSSTPKLKKASH